MPKKKITPASMADDTKIIDSIRNISLDVMSRMPLLPYGSRWQMDVLGSTGPSRNYPRIEITHTSVYWKLNRSCEIHYYLNDVDENNDGTDPDYDNAMLSFEFLDFAKDEQHRTSEYRYLDLPTCYAMILGLFETFDRKMKGNKNG